jgi:dimethylhistidine N-methyltransferase
MPSSLRAVSYTSTYPVVLHDCAPPPDDFCADVIAGLQRAPKELSCKYFYDARGSQLFDRICELDEYYPTRTERDILCEHGAAMARALGPDCLLIEYGSGSSSKTTILLDKLLETHCDPAAYVPLDISREHLLHSAQRLAAIYAPLPVVPVCADYTREFSLPNFPTASRRVVYFPGSTIGNFTPQEAQQFLSRIATLCGADGGLLIGVDLKKDASILHNAYNDAAGVTAEFNLNLLQRINSELGAHWPLQNFAHVAFYNEAQGRIEMHLESLCTQTLFVDDIPFHFAASERIHTENSHKYSLDEFAALAAPAGWEVQQVWTDKHQWFSVQYLTTTQAQSRITVL